VKREKYKRRLTQRINLVLTNLLLPAHIKHFCLTLTRTFAAFANLGYISVSGNSALISINEINLRRARLVLGWVTVSGFKSQSGTFISVCDQPCRSTQPGHPFVGRSNEYQSKGGDALWLRSGRYGSCVGGR